VGDRLTWLGHATVLVELDGAAVLTDPLLRPRVAHLRRHAPAPRTPARVDAILISHLHRDHLDLPSLARLDPAAPVVVPRGGARVLRRSGREVLEVTAGEAVELAGLRIGATAAVHDGRRSPLSRPVDALGYVVAARRRVYFAGDTARFDAMAELAGMDVALLPISGWGPRLGPGHMDPQDAAAAVALLRPRLAIPIHWGTFAALGRGRRARGDAWEPARAFAARVAEVAPAVAVCLLAPGESTPIPTRAAARAAAGSPPSGRSRSRGRSGR
jgi:L-ascorbate metabolism protein UlaG (beta-lactamase superfamily)